MPIGLPEVSASRRSGVSQTEGHVPVGTLLMMCDEPIERIIDRRLQHILALDEPLPIPLLSASTRLHGAEDGADQSEAAGRRELAPAPEQRGHGGSISIGNSVDVRCDDDPLGCGPGQGDQGGADRCGHERHDEARSAPGAHADPEAEHRAGAGHEPDVREDSRRGCRPYFGPDAVHRPQALIDVELLEPLLVEQLVIVDQATQASGAHQRVLLRTAQSLRKGRSACQQCRTRR